jgi:hypothetical protein
MIEVFTNASQTIEIISLFACASVVLGLVAAIYLMISDR